MSASLKCPHCSQWNNEWDSVLRDTPKNMFDTWICKCAGKSCWFAGAPVLIRADHIDKRLEWKIND